MGQTKANKADQPLDSITVQEIADRLGVDPGGIYTGLRKGEIPHIAIGNRKVISRKAFEHFLEYGRWPEPQASAAPAEIERIIRRVIREEIADLAGLVLKHTEGR